ncbi:MAG: hypothetical protein K1X61_00025 [Chitinophagales bacterium]|nr:hypothetical protein [Chitinophagales bacterium]
MSLLLLSGDHAKTFTISVDDTVLLIASWLIPAWRNQSRALLRTLPAESMAVM